MGREQGGRVSLGGGEGEGIERGEGESMEGESIERGEGECIWVSRNG